MVDTVSVACHHVINFLCGNETTQYFSKVWLLGIRLSSLFPRERYRTKFRTKMVVHVQGFKHHCSLKKKTWDIIKSCFIFTQVIQKFDHLFKVILLGDSGTGKSSLLFQVIQKFDHFFKVILLGDSGTGKSSLLCRFRDGDVSDKIVEVTGGIVFDHIIFNVGSEFVKMQVRGL